MIGRLLAVVLILLAATPSLAGAEEDPRAVVQQLSDCLLDVMKHGSELGFEGRAEKLQPVVSVVYDMAAMTKGTLGPAAAKLSSEEAGRLAEAYRRYSVATYADQFDGWAGERFVVGRPRPTENGLVVVPSQIVPASGTATEIDYLLHQDGEHWQIVDVLFDGTISQVAVRRSEFVPIFRREGLAGLIAVLDGKSVSLGKK